MRRFRSYREISRFRLQVLRLLDIRGSFPYGPGTIAQLRPPCKDATCGTSVYSSPSSNPWLSRIGGVPSDQPDRTCGFADQHRRTTETDQSLGRPSRTGVRLSTPEGCDLWFYGCGDTGVPTGSRLRIAITAGGRCWSRSVYRAGQFSVLRWGRRSGSRAAPGQLSSAHLATHRAEYRRLRTQKGSIGGLYPPLAEGPSDASRHDATCCRPRL